MVSELLSERESCSQVGESDVKLDFSRWSAAYAPPDSDAISTGNFLSRLVLRVFASISQGFSTRHRLGWR